MVAQSFINVKRLHKILIINYDNMIIKISRFSTNKFLYLADDTR